MANNIHGKDKVVEITSLWKSLTEQINQAVTVVESYKNATSSLPSDYVNTLQKQKKIQEEYITTLDNLKRKQKAYTEDQKEQERIAKLLSKATAKLKAEKGGETKAYHQVNEQLKIARKERRDEARTLAQVTSLYQRVQNGINNLSQRYKDLALRKELNGKLNKSEEIELGKLEAKLMKYNTALKTVDSKIGNHQRNVGNYKSGFDGLGNSVAQVSRELPAFANSLQTGFMAISNNLPILFDELGRTRTQNKALASEGKATTSVFKSLGKAIFSVQTALSLGVVALTVYGKDIVEYLATLTGGDPAQKEFNKNIREMTSETMKSGNSLKLLSGIVTNTTNSDIARNKALQELSKTIPELNGMTIEQEGAMEKVVKMSDRYIKATQKRALADAFSEKIAEKMVEKFTNQTAKLEDVEVSFIETAKNMVTSAFNPSAGAIQTVNTQMEAQAKTTEKLDNEIDNLTKGYQDALTEFFELSDGLEGFSNDDGAGTVHRDTIMSISEQWRIAREQAEAYGKLLNQYVTDRTQGTEEERNEAKKSSDEEYNRWYEQQQAKVDKKYYDMLRQKEAWSTEWNADQLAILGNTFDRLSELYDMDASAFAKLFDGKKNTVQDWANASGEAIKGLFNLTQNTSTRELDEIKANYEFRKKFAGESEEAQENLRKQYDEKRRRAENKRLQKEKDAKLFEAFINTAVAVVSALPNIPLSIAVGVLGAATIASIASQEVPKFKDGVRGFSGGLAIVGDGGVSEYVKTPDGGVYKTPNKDTLVNLPKGTDVFKNENEFDREFNNILKDNGILSYHLNGMDKESSKGLSANEFKEGISDLKKTIDNKESAILNLDKKGINIHLMKNHSKRISLNNRVTFKGKSV